MSRRLSILDNIRVASPCPAAWKDMTGDNRVRICTVCDRTVFNLSELSPAAASQLIRSVDGRLSTRCYQRADGTILTRNCPAGVRRARKGLAITTGVIAIAFVCIGFALSRVAPIENHYILLHVSSYEPVSDFICWANAQRFAPRPAPLASQQKLDWWLVKFAKDEEALVLAEQADRTEILLDEIRSARMRSPFQLIPTRFDTSFPLDDRIDIHQNWQFEREMRSPRDGR